MTDVVADRVAPPSADALGGAEPSPSSVAEVAVVAAAPSLAVEWPEVKWEEQNGLVTLKALRESYATRTDGMSGMPQAFSTKT